MRLLPEGFHEVGPNLRWGIEWRLRLIEEVASTPQSSGIGGPGMEEGMERIRRAQERRDRKAEDEAMVDYMRAEVREWWQDFPERQLLTGLYRRAALERERRGSTDSGRPPDLEEGLRVARALLADIAVAARFDFEWESEAVPIALADHWLSLKGKRRPAALQEYIKRSRCNRAHFDALEIIWKELNCRGESNLRPLVRWRAEVVDGLRRRPDRKPVPPHRPVRAAQLVRDVQIQVTIGVLRRVGVKPRGSSVSGCGIVSEALELSEETVTRIWKERIWERPFEPVRKHSKAIAERTLPLHTTED